MKIITSSYSFAAFDGKIILRTVIDKPEKSDTIVLNYLDDYSTKINVFAREKLYKCLLEQYASSDNRRNRFGVYNFSFKIIGTYESDNLNSYLMISRLYRSDALLVSNADSVIVQCDSILPPKLITRKSKKDEVLVLNKNGIPSWVDVTSGDISMTPAAKSISRI